jgi:hypothetical protein
MRSVLGVVAALLFLSAPAFAQDADDPASAEIKEMERSMADDVRAMDRSAEVAPASDESRTVDRSSGDNAGNVSQEFFRSGSSRTETRRHSHGVEAGVSVAAPVDAMPSQPGRPGGGGGPGALAGDWTLLVDGGQSCRVTLTDTPHFGGWSVQTRGCDKDFFLVSRWIGGEGEIQFSDAYDKVAGQLTRTGRNRFEGTRGSDGARIVLTR